MSNNKMVFVRGDDGKFEQWKGQYTISTTEKGLEKVSLWPNMQAPQHYSGENVAMFRDLDLNEPIPDEVQAVVCYLLERPTGGQTALMAWGSSLLEVVGHRLTDEIDDGKVVER